MALGDQDQQVLLICVVLALQRTAPPIKMSNRTKEQIPEAGTCHHQERQRDPVRDRILHPSLKVQVEEETMVQLEKFLDRSFLCSLVG